MSDICYFLPSDLSPFVYVCSAAKSASQRQKFVTKIFKVLELEFLLSSRFLGLNIGLVFNLFYYNYATNFMLFR